jgi:flagellin-like protein
MNRNKSGISPVMATVILVAIAIVIAIAVAFWASGLVGVFTRFEKLEITSAYYVSDQEGVKLTVKNTGSADASIDNIFVNGRPCDGGCGNVPSPDSPKTIAVGDSETITVANPPTDVTGGQWKPGVTYEIAIHTASGKTYPVSVLIP